MPRPCRMRHVLDDVIDLLARLVAIDSVNPSLVPGGAGEARDRRVRRGLGADAGLEAEVLEATPGRPSVLVRARGTGGGRTLLLCGHLDTVGVEGMTDPHAPRIDGDRLYGRGAYDMKARPRRGAARLPRGRGARPRRRRRRRRGRRRGAREPRRPGGRSRRRAPTPRSSPSRPSSSCVVAHKGFVWTEIEVTGRAAHGSRPHLGVDAIVKTGPDADRARRARRRARRARATRCSAAPRSTPR